MIYITVLTGVILILLLLAPFWIGPGGLLQASSQVNSLDELKALKDAVIQRYLEDEKAFKEGNLSAGAWDRRRSFLSNRYIDAARRLDFLEHTKRSGGVS